MNPTYPLVIVSTRVCADLVQDPDELQPTLVHTSGGASIVTLKLWMTVKSRPLTFVFYSHPQT